MLANKSKVEEVSGTSNGGKTFTPEEEQEIMGRLRRQLDEQASTLGTVPVFQRALQYGNNVAIKDQNGEFSYARLYMGAKRLAADISSICGECDIGYKRKRSGGRPWCDAIFHMAKSTRVQLTID